jgi:hypothetical protein
MPILQLVRDHRQVVRQPKNLHVVLAACELAGRESVLQQRAGLRQFAQPAPQRGQDPGGVEDQRVVLAQLEPRLVQRLSQIRRRGARIAVAESVCGGCGEAVTKGHLDMLPA